MEKLLLIGIMLMLILLVVLTAVFTIFLIPKKKRIRRK